MIRLYKQSSTSWIIYDTQTGKSADIVKISEHNFNGCRSQYRVDSRGITVSSKINHFSTAKSIAIKAINN